MCSAAICDLITDGNMHVIRECDFKNAGNLYLKLALFMQEFIWSVVSVIL